MKRSSLLAFAATLTGLLVPVCAFAEWQLRPYETPRVITNSLEHAQLLLMDGEAAGTTVCTNETEATPEIVALARALKYNPALIYEYVRNRIAYDPPSHGVVNGANGCLLAGRGNDWDQACLVASLLRVSGFQTRFAYAEVIFNIQDVANMLGVVTGAVINVFSPGICGGALYEPDPDVFILPRVWVEFYSFDTWLAVDAAWKEYRQYDGIDLKTACGYNLANVLDDVSVGATIGTDNVRNLNASNLADRLTSYTTNLVGYVRTNKPNSSYLEIVGGREMTEDIIQYFQSGVPQNWPSLPYWPNNPFWPETLETWDHVPTNKILRVQVQHDSDIDCIVPGYQLAGNRLTLFYDAADSYRPKLRLGGDLLAAGTATTSNSTHNLTISIDHGYYNGASCDSNRTYFTKGFGKYLIVHDFEGISAKAVERESLLLQKSRHDGLTDDSEDILGGGMQLSTMNGLRQWHLTQRMLGQLSDVLCYTHHFVGLMGQESGYYIDLPQCLVDYTTRNGGTGPNETWFRASAFIASALEHGVLEQSQGTNNLCVSTIKLLGINNGDGNRTFVASNSNWAAVRPLLVNYDGLMLDNIGNSASNGATFLLPGNGEIQLLQWSGAGYAKYKPDTSGSVFGMMIEGGYNGAHSGTPNNFVSKNAANNVDVVFHTQDAKGRQRDTEADPVDMYTGYFVYEKNDLSVGIAPPRGLNFTRYYNSGRRYSNHPLGYGWTHGYDVYAQTCSDPAIMLGERQATDAAHVLVYSILCLDLLEQEPDAKKWLTAALASRWVVDALTQQTVLLELGDRSMEFVRLPNGTYNPPPGETASLSKDGVAYTLRQRYGITWRFRSDDRLDSWEDADSNRLSFAYNSCTNLQSVTDAGGRSITLAYTTGNLMSATDSTGGSVSYQHTGSNLTQVTDVEGHQWALGYGTNDTHMLTTLNDPLGVTTVSNVYNNAGQIETQNNAFSNTWSFYTSGYRDVIKNPLGEQHVYCYDQQGRKLYEEDDEGLRLDFFYDGQNQVTQRVDSLLRVTTYCHDGHHNLTSVIDPATNRTEMTYDAQHRLVAVSNALGHVIRNGYDLRHHLTSTIDPIGNLATNIYDSSGLFLSATFIATNGQSRSTTFGYDFCGNVTNVVYPDDSQTRATWSARADMTSFTDGNNNTTTNVWDKRRLLIAEHESSGAFISNVWNGAGLLVTNRNRRGEMTTYSYTATHEPFAILYPDGSSVTNIYDAANRVTMVWNSRGVFTSNTWDKAGRLAMVRDALGHTFSNTFDAVGNVVRMTDNLGHSVSNRYDTLNRPVASVDALGTTSSVALDPIGRLTNTMDRAGKVAWYEYNALGFLTAKHRPDGGVEQNAPDAFGNRVAFVNAAGKTTMSFGFDSMNRVVATTNAIGSVWRYTYDPAGNVTNRLDALNRSTRLEYDSLNRLTQKTYPDASTVKFTYDPTGNLTNLVDGVGTNRVAYDCMNRLTWWRDTYGQAVSNVFDKVGNRTSVIYPDGKTVQYSFDLENRVTNVTDWATRSWSFTFDSGDRLSGATYPNGVTVSYLYDANNRLTNYVYQKNGTNLIARSMVLNALGFKTVETIHAGMEPVPPDTWQKHHSDAADRVQHISRRDEYANPERWRDVVSRYDSDGNPTNRQASYRGNASTDTMQWDYEDRLTSFNGVLSTNLWMDTPPPPQGITFTYDGLGKRVGRNGEGNSRRFVLDRVSRFANVLVENDGTNGPIRHFVWAGTVGLLAQVETNGTTFYPLCDEQGSVLALTDSAGNVTDQFTYSPYGELWNRSGTNATVYTYLGGLGVRWEGGSLYFCNARFYDARQSRFLNSDPIGLGGGANLYMYAMGNPAFYIDPSGWCGSSAGATRFMGAVQMVGGAFETGIGMVGGLLTAETGVGAFAGGIVAFHGADTAAAGFQQMMTGRQQDSLTVAALQNTGMSPYAAHLTDAGLSVVGTFGMAGMSVEARAAAVAAEQNAVLMDSVTLSRSGRVDPSTLRLPPTRAEGADPFKLNTQMRQYGSSTEGMPSIQITRGLNGELMINDGVTRATRIDTFNQINNTRNTVPIEVIENTTYDLRTLPTVRNPNR